MTLLPQPRERQTIPDVERSGFCFTDGCATVSPQLAREMAAGLWQRGRLPAGLVPTAFQIRFSGVKGMVALDPSLRGRRWAGGGVGWGVARGLVCGFSKQFSGVAAV